MKLSSADRRLLDALQRDATRAQADLAEIAGMSCFTVAGERDYVLHVVVPDMETYTRFLQSEVLKHPAVRSASSTFVLQRVKYTTMLPLAE
jgi:DNA-binding Lrp family transcriptional regulator